MSGGGIGQLCNLAKYDEIVIHGGTNEILSTRTNEEFVYAVHKAEEKIRHPSSDRKVFLFLPVTPTLGPVEDGWK